MKKGNRDSVGRDVDRILSLIGELQRRASFRLFQSLAREKITMPQFVALQTLQEMGESTMGDLADQMCVTRAAMTSTMNRMVSRGYVRRERSKEDRRVVHVRATPKGRQAAGRIHGEMEALVRSVMEKMKPQERRVWVGTYERICSLLKGEGA